MAGTGLAAAGRRADCPLLPLVRDSVVVLIRSGRAPSWHALVAGWEGDGGNPFAHPASNEHVELMLRVAHREGLQVGGAQWVPSCDRVDARGSGTKRWAAAGRSSIF